MWRDAAKKDLAAQALRITAKDLATLGCIDEIVPEPEGAAHADDDAAAALLDVVLQKHFAEMIQVPVDAMLAARYEKFRKMAQFFRVEQ